MESTAKRVSVTSGGVRLSNRPSPTPNTPSTSGIQFGTLSPKLSAPPHSAHPGLPPPTQSGYYYPPYLSQDPMHMHSHPWISQVSPPLRPDQGIINPHSVPPPLPLRNPSIQLHPGTLSPTLPDPLPSTSSHTHLLPRQNGVYSSLVTPLTTTALPGAGGGGGDGTNPLNTGASTFLPKKITIKTLDGREVDLSAWKKAAPGPPVVGNNASSIYQTRRKGTPAVKMETIEAERLAKLNGKKARKAEKKKAAEEKKRKEEETRKAKEEIRKEAEKGEEEEKEKIERERIRKEEEREHIKKEGEVKEAVEEERKIIEAEKMRLVRETEGLWMKEEKQVVARLAEEKPEEGEIAGNPTSEEPPREVGEDFSSPKICPPIKKRARPSPLDLSASAIEYVFPALPYIPATAEVIKDLGRSFYPEGVIDPKPELNVDWKGRFRYGREFLLQFMAVCTQKPDVPLDIIGLEAIGDQPHSPLTRDSSGRHRTSSAQQASIFGFKPETSNGFTMGQFSAPKKMTSEERFAMSRLPTPNTTIGLGGPGSDNTASKRTRSKRGKRNQSDKIHAGNVFDNQASEDPELIAPLEVSADSWTGESPTDEERDVEGKVKVLLDDLTMDTFDPFSDQIIEWANKSEAEKDGRTLNHVTRLIFEKATDDVVRSEVYARLCRKMMEKISPAVQDRSIRSANGKPITGGQLFRKHLLSHCQEDFERRWGSKAGATSAAPAKVSEDAAVKGAAGASDKADLCSGGHSVGRQGLGPILFVGELYKLQMLTERIMHEYVKRLLGNVGDLEEEGIECLCRFLTTIGKLLDNPKARTHMDVYFTRLKKLGKSSDVVPRVRSMIRDLIELRERKWIPRDKVAAPTTTAQVHKEVEEEAAKRGLTPGTDSEPSRSSNGGTGIDLKLGGTPELQRRKLKLLPRSKPTEAENKGKSGLTCRSEGGGDDGVLRAISEAKTKKISESEGYSNKLPSEYTRHTVLQVAPQLCKPKHPAFYFGSGDVVVVCEDTSFRVQSHLLSNNSQVFRDTLEPGHSNWEHLSDGCPCVHLSDAAEDFATLLRVFYTSGFPHRHKTPDFTTFSSLLRMTTKYQLQEIRSQILFDLFTAYPTTISEYEGSPCLGEAVFGSPPPHPNLVLDLFVTCKVAFALPFAYYRACIAGDPASLGASTRGLVHPSDTLKTALHGQARLKVDEVQLARRVAFQDCTAWGACLRKSPAGRGQIFDWIHPEVMTRSGILERGDSPGPGYCVQCSQAFRKELSKAKKDTWENLPSYFGLPPWDDTVN